MVLALTLKMASAWVISCKVLHYNRIMDTCCEWENLGFSRKPEEQTQTYSCFQVNTELNLLGKIVVVFQASSCSNASLLSEQVSGPKCHPGSHP